MLALLVFVDRVRQVVGFLYQHVVHAEGGRAPGRAQSSGAGTDYRNPENIGQVRTPIFELSLQTTVPQAAKNTKGNCPQSLEMLVRKHARIRKP